MAKEQFRGSFNGGEYNISISLSVYLWKEDNVYFVYAPALDITGYGNSDEEAKRSFEITLTEFLNYTNSKETFYDELEHLGWSVNRRKRRVHAPEFEDMLEDNKSLRDILNKGGLQRINRNIELAL